MIPGRSVWTVIYSRSYQIGPPLIHLGRYLKKYDIRNRKGERTEIHCSCRCFARRLTRPKIHRSKHLVARWRPYHVVYQETDGSGINCGRMVCSGPTSQRRQVACQGSFIAWPPEIPGPHYHFHGQHQHTATFGKERMQEQDQMA
jgi:hypothetical protein